MHSILSHNATLGEPSQLIIGMDSPISCEPRTLSQNIKYQHLSVCRAMLRNGHKVAP